MALGINRNRISAKGATSFKIRELYPTPSNTLISLGAIASMQLTDTPDDVDIHDAAGFMIQSIQGNEKVFAVVVLQQTSKEEIDAVRGYRGKQYDMIAHIPLEGTGWQHIRMYGKITSAIDLPFVAGQKREIKLTLKLLAPKAAFTGTPAGLSFTKNVPYVVYDDTTEGTEQSDTASDEATAIV
jgi:hypothetical protein